MAWSLSRMATPFAQSSAVHADEPLCQPVIQSSNAPTQEPIGALPQSGIPQIDSPSRMLSCTADWTCVTTLG